MKASFFRTIFFIACSLVLVPSALSQPDPSSLLSATSVSTTTSNYYYAKPNELTIIVNVMGFVQRPGRYEISITIDLINLLALAGGPMPDGSMNDVKITRLVNTGSRYDRKQFTLNLEQLAKVSSAELVLQPGDIIELDRTSWSVVRDVFTVVGFAALITTTTASIISLTRR